MTRLLAVCCQYDRDKYRGAVERLTGFLQGLADVDATLVVVDNANPGRWYHEVTADLVHLGGENSCREFSAFERGLAFLRSTGRTADVYAFVTDAFLAYGDDYLELIHGNTVRASVELDACVGWVDSFGEDLVALGYAYRSWMRTSFFLVPASRLPSLAPLAVPLEAVRIFGPDARHPFRDGGGLSPRLRELLLTWLTTEETGIARDEVWHSRFDLDATTFEDFKAKVLCILREHLLSARLQQAEVPCFDFRFVHRLEASGIRTLTAPERRANAWLGWRRPGGKWAPAGYKVDHLDHPDEIRHGEAAELVAYGWIVASAPVREVELHLGDAVVFRGRADLPRPDVLEAFPAMADDRRGFEVRACLDKVPPGDHPLELRVPGAGISEVVSRVRVLPRCDFAVKRVFVPGQASPERPLPVSVEGQLLSSHPLLEVSVGWDGEATTIEPAVAEDERSPSGLHSYSVSLIGAVPWEPRSQHVLELRFHTDEGTEVWRTFAAVVAAETPPHEVSLRRVADWDPRSETAEVHVKGAVLAPHGDERLVFLRDGEPLWDGPLDGPRTHDGQVVFFDLRRALPGIPPGVGEFAVALRRPDAEARLLRSWNAVVKPLQPVVHVEHLDVLPPDEQRPAWILSLGGWVENHVVVEHLHLWIDDQCAEAVPLDLLREDVAASRGQRVTRRQGFLVETPLTAEPGDHRLRVKLLDGTLLWERVVTFPEALFRVRSETLARLLDEREPRLTAAICIDGTVTSQVEDVEARLDVDGDVVDRQPVVDGSFLLRHRLPGFRRGAKPGTSQHAVRVSFHAGGRTSAHRRTLYDSGTVNALVERPEDLGDLVRAFDLFLERFDVEEKLGLSSTDGLLEWLVARNSAPFADYARMLHEIRRVLEAKPAARPAADVSPRPGRPLKVLFATWCVPCLRHGGGVWMTHLLKELSKRHELTVVYCYSEHEGDWIEDVRPYAARLIGVERRYKSPPNHEDRDILDHLYREYVPELRAVIDKELRTGRYDLVEYYYTWMLPYVSRLDVPRLLTVVEEPFSAALTHQAYSAETDDGRLLLRLDALLRRFYLSAVALPKSFRHLFTLTEEETDFLRRHQGGKAELHLNPIGVDLDHMDRERRDVEPLNGPRPEPPTVVFLGNYHHPPNVDAALYVAEKVMPRLWKLHPDAVFEALGAFPPAELEALASDPRIRVTGFVDDFRPYLRRGAAFLAPLFTGAGMRVKLLEAMACSIPVVATPLAANGLQARDGESFLLAETADEFADAARRCIEDPALGEAVGRGGRELVESRHSSTARARQREALWQRVLGDERATARVRRSPGVASVLVDGPRD